MDNLSPGPYRQHWFQAEPPLSTDPVDSRRWSHLVNPFPSGRAPVGILSLDLTVGLQADHLTVVGELDLSGVDRLDRVLRWLARSGRPLDVDLAGLRFIDCGGWRVLCDATQRSGHRGGSSAVVRVVATSRQVRRLTTLLAVIEQQLAPDASTPESADLSRSRRIEGLMSGPPPQ